MLNSLILSSILLVNLVTLQVEVVESDPLTDYINELAVYECRNCPPKYDRVDSNGELSYSCLQFQERTFREQVAKYDMLPDIEPHEIMNLFYDCSFQKKLAVMMLQENPKFIWRWKTSVLRGLGLPPNY